MFEGPASAFSMIQDVEVESGSGGRGQSPLGRVAPRITGESASSSVGEDVRESKQADSL